jgi:hypothetical protein
VTQRGDEGVGDNSWRSALSRYCAIAPTSIYSHTVFALLLTFHIKRVVDAIQRAVVAPQVDISKSVLCGGRSFGIARHCSKNMIPPTRVPMKSFKAKDGLAISPGAGCNSAREHQRPAHRCANHAASGLWAVNLVDEGSA